MKRINKIAFIAIAILMMATAASAIPYTFDLTVPNTALANTGLQAPYATVSVDLANPDIDVATVTVTARTGYYLLGGQGVFAINTLGGAASASNFVLTTYLSDPDVVGDASISQNGAGNVSDFGNFNVVLKAFDGFTHAYTTFTFTLTNRSNDNWTSSQGLLLTNNTGYFAAGHVFPIDNSLATGFAGNGTAPVPEPATLILLGAGLLGLAGYRKVR